MKISLSKWASAGDWKQKIAQWISAKPFSLSFWTTVFTPFSCPSKKFSVAPSFNEARCQDYKTQLTFQCCLLLVFLRALSPIPTCALSWGLLLPLIGLQWPKHTPSLSGLPAVFSQSPPEWNQRHRFRRHPSLLCSRSRLRVPLLISIVRGPGGQSHTYGSFLLLSTPDTEANITQPFMMLPPRSALTSLYAGALIKAMLRSPCFKTWILGRHWAATPCGLETSIHSWCVISSLATCASKTTTICPTSLGRRCTAWGGTPNLTFHRHIVSSLKT